MQIEIEFRPDDGRKQTLYADLSTEDVERLEGIVADPGNANDVVYITSQVKKDGPSRERLFRVGRIKIKRVR